MDIRHEESILGPEWAAIYSKTLDIDVKHFREAMTNIIRHPNLNSTVIMRADILMEPVGDALVKYDLPLDREVCPLVLNIEDTEPRELMIDEAFELESTVVRRIIPRNPRRDAVIMQTCKMYKAENSLLVVYIPHLDSLEEIPFYLPPAKGVAILYRNNYVSVHYSMFDYESLARIPQLGDSDRSIRIAYRLLQTSTKHSKGVLDGYQKRVNHDVIVDKVAFQDCYILLKQKYAKELVANWVENTDPTKHVFEDLSIAAFLIILWEQMYDSKDSFEFADLGCGNGLLVNILNQEGYKGKGYDARARKSWKTYPQSVQDNLLERLLVPRVILNDDAPELDDPVIHTLEFENKSRNTFLIGNHSDELTVWMPLLGHPFMTIPCCSHALTGAKYRFPGKSADAKSTYASLVDHVEDVAKMAGWKVEKEWLRIPSTRNAALIGRTKPSKPQYSIEQIIEKEGGADGWVTRTNALRGKSPRSH